MPTLTAAQEEAYAYFRPSDLWAIAVILEHAMIPGGPLRFIHGVDEDVSLVPKAGDAAVLFKATTFSWKPAPQAAKEGPGEGELQVEGVSAEIYDAARWAGVDGNPVQTTVLEYRFTLTNGVPDFNVSAPHARYPGLRIEKINYSATSVSAQLKVRDWGAMNFPRLLFSRDLYPALHG